MARKNLRDAFAQRGLSVLSGYWITAQKQPIHEVVSRSRRTATFGLSVQLCYLSNHQIRWHEHETYDPYATCEEWQMTGSISVADGIVGEITIFFKPREYFGQFLIKLPKGQIIE